MRDLLRVRALVALASISAAALAGCTPAGEATDRVSCAEAMRAAVMTVEADDQLRLLDEALLACASYDRYLAELASYPGAIGYSPERYITLRCSSVEAPRLRNSPTCRTASPTTTPPPTSVAEPVYAAATLDGRVVELRPSDGVQFAGDVPAAVQRTVDVAGVSGCPGVLAQRDEWSARAGGDDAAAEEASVYAQHAINVALWIGCDGAQPATPDSTTG